MIDRSDFVEVTITGLKTAPYWLSVRDTKMTLLWITCVVAANRALHL